MRLIDANEPVSRGSVLRFPSKLIGYGEIVDLMVCYSGELSLVVTTGPKAGHVICTLPREALIDDSKMVDPAWLMSNWQKWIWPETEVSNVRLLPKYASPTI